MSNEMTNGKLRDPVPASLVVDSRYYFKTDLIRLDHWAIATTEAPLNRQLILAGCQRIVPGLRARRRTVVGKHKPISHLWFIGSKHYRFRQISVFASVIALRIQSLI